MGAVIGRIRQLFDHRREALAGARGPAAGMSDPARRCCSMTVSGDRSRIDNTAAFYWTAGLFAAIIILGYGQRRRHS
jgi:hypothetical protein